MREMKHYFLFGELPCTRYDENDFDGVADCLIPYPEGVVHIHDEMKDSIYDLLDAFNGWNDYRVITEEQYKTIKGLASRYA